MAECYVLFNYLAIAAEQVPVLSQQFNNLLLNDVNGAMKPLNDFYIQLPDPELYARNLLVGGLRVEPGWSIRDYHAVLVVAVKDSETMGQAVSVEMQKYLYYRATQDIYRKYHDKLEPKFKDPTVDLPMLVKFFETLITTKQEVSIKDKFTGKSPIENNMAIQIYNKINNKLSNTIPSTQPRTAMIAEANMASYQTFCRHPKCRGNRKFARHTWDKCFRNPKSTMFVSKLGNPGLGNSFSQYKH